MIDLENENIQMKLIQEYSKGKDEYMFNAGLISGSEFLYEAHKAGLIAVANFVKQNS